MYLAQDGDGMMNKIQRKKKSKKKKEEGEKREREREREKEGNKRKKKNQEGRTQENLLKNIHHVSAVHIWEI